MAVHTGLSARVIAHPSSVTSLRLAPPFLAAARSRSGSDSPPGCHSTPSRRFATHRGRLPRFARNDMIVGGLRRAFASASP